MPTILALHKVTTDLTFGATNYAPKRLFSLLESWEATRPNGLGDLVLTFDDGYAHLTNVLPKLLARFRVGIIVFIPTAWIGKSNRWDYSSWLRRERHLDRQEIELLSRSGIAFGSHGHSHSDLSSLANHSLESELSRSRDILEGITGTSVRTISYPFGRADQRVAEAAARVGFSDGYTMMPPTAHDVRLLTGRTPLYAYDTLLSLRLKTGGGIWRDIENAKSRIANRLSGGTRLWQRLVGHDG